MFIRRLSCIMALAAFVLAPRPASVSAGTVGVHAASADLPLQIVNSSISLNSSNQSATFDLQFNHAPDFYTLDSAGRVADSFQYFINTNWSGNPQNLQLNYGQFNDVVRGDEIHTSGKLLIRDATFPANPDPNSGGWGPVIASLPFEVQGDNLTFIATYNQLRATKGSFSYEAYTTHFGSTVSTVQGLTVPVPPSAWAGLAMLGGMGAVVGLRRVRRHGI